MAQPAEPPDRGGKLNGHPAFETPSDDELYRLVVGALDAVRAALIGITDELSKLSGMSGRVEHIDEVLNEFEPLLRRMTDNPAARFMQRNRGGT